MLYLGREPTKTEPLGEKNFPVGTQVSKTRVPEQGGPKWTEYNKVDQCGLNKNI